jgi:hypothetical protein
VEIHADGFTLSGLVSVSAGANDFSMLCNEVAGNVQVTDPKLALIYMR